MRLLRFAMIVGSSVLAALSACASQAPAAGVDGGPGSDSGESRSDSGGVPSTVPEADFPDALAAAWCDVLFECDCQTTIDTSVDACLARVSEATRHRADFFRDMGLTYDDGCPAHVAHQIAVRGCGGFMRPVEVGCEACALYHGVIARGEPCTQLDERSVTTCAPGLFCIREDGGTGFTCEDPCEASTRYVGAGEPCDTAGVSCDFLNAQCDASGICVAFPGLGESCATSHECSGASYCDASTSLCVAAISRGETCTEGSQCETAFCDGGVCVSFCWPQPF